MGQDQSHNQINPVNVSKSQPHKTKATLKDIVVVSDHKGTREVNPVDGDEELAAISTIKLSRPILINGPNSLEASRTPRLIPGPFTEMILRYQVHLSECAEVISLDQNVLSKRIKEVDSLALSVNKSVAERQKNYEHAIMQFSTMINDLAHLVSKIDAKLKDNVSLFQTVNKQLPGHLQIQDSTFNQSEKM